MLRTTPTLYPGIAPRFRSVAVSVVSAPALSEPPSGSEIPCEEMLIFALSAITPSMERAAASASSRDSATVHARAALRRVTSRKSLFTT